MDQAKWSHVLESYSNVLLDDTNQKFRSDYSNIISQIVTDTH